MQRLFSHAPALLVIATGLVLTLFDGGFAETSWYPAALFLLALSVLALLFAPPVAGRRPGPFGCTLVALGLLVLWTYASLLWALLPGNAWEAANRSLLLWLALALAGLRLWRPGHALVALGLVAGGIVLVAAGTLAVAVLGDDPAALFLGGRLSEPAAYANATACLLLIGFWPAVHLAVAREVPWPLRGCALAGATLLLTTALLTQSRGGAIAFGATAVLFLLAHPRPWPALAALATTVVVVAVAFDPIVAVRSADSVAQLDEQLREAVRFIAVGTGVAFVIGAAAALAGGPMRRRGVPSSGVRAKADRGFLALAGVAAVAGVVTLALSSAWLDDRWTDFRDSGYEQVEEGGESRFTGSLGSGRYDFYRVAVDAFADRPLLGVGAESFAVPYLVDRRTAEAPRYAHSLLFGVLSQLGAVGALLLAGFAACAGWGLWRTLRRNATAGRGAAAAAFAGFGVWFAQGMVDWLWEFPALSILALALLGVALRTRPVGDDDVDERAVTRGTGASIVAPDPSATALPRAVRAVLVMGVVTAAVSFALPAAAARLRQSALDDRRTDPAATLDQLDSAAALNPLAAEPLLQRGVLARRYGRIDQARSSLTEAVAREPERWFGHFELGLLDAQESDRPSALRRLDRAIALNPRQQIIREARRQVAAGRRIDIDAIEQELYSQVAGRENAIG